MDGRVIVDEAPVRHGGDLDEARRLFAHAPQPWIDLSTGINPVPYPIGDLPPEVFTRLPAPAEGAALEEAASAAYGSRTDEVVAAPGTQALIELLPRLRRPGRIAVVGPTYAEHARSWRKAGHRVVEIPSPEDADAAEVVVVCNPNNPDGRVWPRRTLVELARRLAPDGWLVVDEAFADFEDVESLAADIPDGTVVLRSFGKTFGLAGLRLGFAVARPELAAGLRSALGPWAVSGPAVAIGCRALADPPWLRQARRDREEDALRLDGLMRPLASLVGGTRLFRCYEPTDAAALFEHLGRAGIWVRRFDGRPWLRFGLPGSEPEWQRLRDALDRPA